MVSLSSYKGDFDFKALRALACPKLILDTMHTIQKAHFEEHLCVRVAIKLIVPLDNISVLYRRPLVQHEKRIIV